MNLNDERYPVEKFLIDNTMYYEQPGELYGTVYCIMNIHNGKKYIGSTVDLYSRARQYIRYCFREKVDLTQNISNAMRDTGIENFRMMPIIGCSSALELAYWELYYIREYDTYIPHGYNMSFNTSARVKKGSRKDQVIGIKHSADNRRKHSLEIVGINLEQKICYLADSAALIGTMLNTHRATISNACKSRDRYKGWYFYYTYQFPFSFEKSTRYSNAGILTTGIMNDRRANYEYKSIGRCLLTDSHAFLRANEIKCFEIRYDDESPERYTITNIDLSQLENNVS